MDKTILFNSMMNIKKNLIPKPCKNVKKMIQNYEENIIHNPFQFRRKPFAFLRTKKFKINDIAAQRTNIFNFDDDILQKENTSL